MFNEKEQVVGEWQGGPYNYRSAELCEVPVNLPPGTYRFIAWTNVAQEYKIKAAPELTGNQLYLGESKENIYTQDIPDLHYTAGGNIKVDPM